nr:helix-turn-helix transcriptional regulator [Ureibacillus massiliensis]
MKFIQGDTGVAFDANNTKLNYLKRKDDFGARIQKLREQKGLSIQDLEKKLNINDDYLSKTENNLTEPSKFFIHRLAWACGVEYEDLLDDLYYVEHSDILK